MDKSNNNLFSNFKNDFPASIVVFLVALPLCLAIAAASDAPLFSGLIAGVIGGIIVGIISGSALGVSGPAAGLASIVAASIHELGSFEIFLVAVVVSGVIQIILGVIKAGVIGYYFPSSVIKGMLAGIGITIFLKQFEHGLGSGKAEGVTNVFEQIAWSFVNPHIGPVIVCLVSIFILWIWQKEFIQKQSFSKIIQGPLVVVLLGIVMSLVFQQIPSLTLAEIHIVSIPSIKSVGGFTKLFTLPDFSDITNPAIYVTAGTIAIVGSLETLLSVEATDKMDPQKRITPTNKELIAQGAGNIASGLIGGLPVTQVIIRSSTNIMSGGKSKLSAILHGIFLAVCVLAIPGVLNLIPMASLAAILFFVGYKLTRPEIYKQMFRQGVGQFFPFILTIVMIVFTNLLVGIGLGLAIAFIHILWENFKTPYHTELEGADQGKPVTMVLSEQVTFLNKASIIHTLDELPDGILFIIDANKTKMMHPDVLEVFEDFIYNAKTRDIRVETTGFESWTEDSNNLTTEK